AHFIALSHPISVSLVAQAFMDFVFRLHRMPKSIVSDRDKIFTSLFWQELFRITSTELKLSSTYHPHSDGQTERVNQCVEQYLRCMAFSKSHNWKKWLTLVEWWYNTSHRSSINMTPFQALYRHAPNQLCIPESVTMIVNSLDEFLQECQHTIK